LVQVEGRVGLAGAGGVRVRFPLRGGGDHLSWG
jgi:hypothetical protein